MEVDRNENPFNIVGSEIPVTICNPNISVKQTKDGPKFIVQVELEQSIWLALANSELAGMVAETEWHITHSNHQHPLNDNVDAGPVKKRAEAMMRDPAFILWLSDQDQVSGLEDDLNYPYPLLAGAGINFEELDTDRTQREKFNDLLRKFGSASK